MARTVISGLSEQTTGEQHEQQLAGTILLKKRSHHEFRDNFFSSRVADEWNALPDDIKSARTVNGFKCLYKRHRESTVALATEGRKEARSQGAKAPPSYKILIRALTGPQRIISQ